MNKYSEPSFYQAVRGRVVAQLVEVLCYKPESRSFDSRLGSLSFFIDLIFPAALWPWDRLSLQQR